MIERGAPVCDEPSVRRWRRDQRQRSDAFPADSVDAGSAKTATSTISNLIGALGGATCVAGASPFQTAAVTVLADGLDVTSWATGLTISDATTATFVEAPSSSSDYDREHLVRGKAAGAFTVSLHGLAGAPSVAMTVSDVPMNVTSVATSVLTDLVWEANLSPNPSSHPNPVTASVTAMQTFSARPAGTARGHYGYLFATVTYADGKIEELLSGDLVPSTTSPNLVLTPPNGVDDHTGDAALKMHNAGTDRHMVTLRNTAVSECVESSVQVDFARCGVTLGTGYPKINVVMPFANGMRFNISASGGSDDPSNAYRQKVLTPTNGGASFSPFRDGATGTTTTSDFQITVFFSDGSSVNTYANEDDSSVTQIVYWSNDPTCATVDNAANTLTVVEGATCAFVSISVNVTVNGWEFYAQDFAPVVRLHSLRTKAAAFPGGDSGIVDSTDLYPLPCGVDYERFTLSTFGTLTVLVAVPLSVAVHYSLKGDQYIQILTRGAHASVLGEHAGRRLAHALALAREWRVCRRWRSKRGISLMSISNFCYNFDF